MSRGKVESCESLLGALLMTQILMIFHEVSVCVIRFAADSYAAGSICNFVILAEPARPAFKRFRIAGLRNIRVTFVIT